MREWKSEAIDLGFFDGIGCLEKTNMVKHVHILSNVGKFYWERMQLLLKKPCSIMAKLFKGIYSLPDTPNAALLQTIHST